MYRWICRLRARLNDYAKGQILVCEDGESDEEKGTSSDEANGSFIRLADKILAVLAQMMKTTQKKNKSVELQKSENAYEKPEFNVVTLKTENSNNQNINVHN